MGIFDDQIKLPGVITQVEADYSYGYNQAAFGKTDSVVIIGTAFNGPVGVPTPIYSLEHATYIFGDAYDSQTRQEANLIAGVQDAWERGCRTIYCVRVGGKEMFKDFEFCVDSQYRLRVSSQFSTNTGKSCYFLYDNTAGNESISYFKPAKRATIYEKRTGAVVDANSVLENKISLFQTYGLTREDRLVDLIKIFNSHNCNNVLKMSIVDQNGIDVTSSPEVYDIAIGAMFPGAYFIGRDHSACEERTELTFHITAEERVLPFKDLKDTYFRRLCLNTDVSQPYPIYSDIDNFKLLQNLLYKTNVLCEKPWDFLRKNNASELAFVPDELDYEETNLDKFEIYRRLGSGYAVTAHAERRPGKDGEPDNIPRICETPVTNKNRIQPITEGIYSLLEDAEIKYRALVCVAAEDEIKGKLPRAADFKKVSSVPLSLCDNMLQVTPRIDGKDFTSAKKYSFILEKAESTVPGAEDVIFTDKVFPVVAKYEGKVADLIKEVKEGNLDLRQQIMVVGQAAGEEEEAPAAKARLFRVGANGLQALENEGYADKIYIVDGEVYKGVLDREHKVVHFEKQETLDFKVDVASQKLPATHILGNVMDSVFVFKIGEKGIVSPIGDFQAIYNADGEEQPLVVYAENMPFKQNQVILRSALLDNITLDEFCDILNNHPVFGEMFDVELTTLGAENKTEFMGGLISFADEAGDKKLIPNQWKPSEEVVVKVDKNQAVVGITTADRRQGYDYNLYIPYRTTDNFARQLAQHCTYTELKTTPTFGFIGCQRLINTGLANIAKRVDELAQADFHLYAKTHYGNNILDRSDLPYEIGKNVNIVFTQYPVHIKNSNFVYLSNGAAGYAGMVSTLPLDQSSTCQPIQLASVDFVCSQHQLNRLTAAGIVTVRRTFSKGLVITDGVTMAPMDSVFRRLAASRITGAIEDLIRQAAEPFIGKQNHTANRNALQTAIRSSLDKVMGKLIEKYDFELNNDPSIMKYSYIDINYEIVPIYEIREIRNNIKVTETLSSVSTNH